MKQCDIMLSLKINWFVLTCWVRLWILIETKWIQ